MSSYPAGMTLRPITTWPREQTRSRQRSKFSAPWTATLELLDRELFHLGKGNRRADSVLQIAMREQDFRKTDGMPRANAIPDHPGVILNIDGSKGPMSMPCDKFDRWQDNLRAIALSLEALRKVDRYGTTPGNEQYRGWLAIEAQPAGMGRDAACTFLASVAYPNEDLAHQAEWAPRIATDPDIGRSTLRQAMGKAHPDRHGGDQTLWDCVEQAAMVLGLNKKETDR